MKIIVVHPRSSVFYNSKSDTFIKTFSPKLLNRFKFFINLRLYPGNNFHYICNLLNSLNIKTPKVINYSKYHIETANLRGESLEDFLDKNPNNIEIIKKYIEIILILLKNNIYCGDLSLDNFILKNNEIYALDLEDYKHIKFSKYNRKEFLRRLEEKIPSDIYNLILEEIKNSKV
ncbi:MAG: RIO1 family regulatory kinase/ATPase [Cetobacterium sp.]